MAFKPPNPLTAHFSSPSQAPAEIPRLAISLEALDKCGKTHWALYTAPSPICLVSTDPGTYHVYKKALANNIPIPYYLELPFERPDPAILRSNDVDKADHAEWKAQWAKFKNAMAALEQDTTVRTLVWDTASGLWNLAELAYFGKLRGNARIDIRTELNSAFSGVFWSLYKARPELNMILIHRAKKQYAPNSKGEDTWTGKYEREGFGRNGFSVDVSIAAGWDGKRKQFYTHIDPETVSRKGIDLSGRKWYGEDSGFGLLGLEVFPESEDDKRYGLKWWGLE